jgi:hypothetical protein
MWKDLRATCFIPARPLHPCFAYYTLPRPLQPFLTLLIPPSLASTSLDSSRLSFVRFDLARLFSSLLVSPSAASTRPRSTLLIPPSSASTSLDSSHPCSARFTPVHLLSRLTFARFDLQRGGQLGVFPYLHFPFIVTPCDYCST